MKFQEAYITLIEDLDNNRNKYQVKYDGKIYTTYSTSKKGALANIGARLAKENNIKREYYNKFIVKVLNSGYARIIEEKCWKGYMQIGMKKKSKKLVPNCVKKSRKKTK
jgi:hypothetical protein